MNICSLSAFVRTCDAGALRRESGTAGHAARAFAGLVLAAATLLASSQASADVVNWTSWTSDTSTVTAGAAGGTMNLGTTPVTVTVSNTVPFGFTQINSTGLYNYWIPSAPYISSMVSNAPSSPDIIALYGAGTTTITFTDGLGNPISVVNPLIALVSWNGAVVNFGAGVNIEFLSYGTGYFGPGTPVLGTDPSVTTPIVPGTVFTGSWAGNGEVHGVIELPGTYTSISFTDSVSEFWHGFTVGAVTPTYTIGGTVSGLAAGQQVTLRQIFSGDTVTVSTNSPPSLPWSFTNSFPSGSSYNVIVQTQPAGQYCTVTNGSGTVAANVTNVTVNCAPTQTYLYTGRNFTTYVAPYSASNFVSGTLTVSPPFPATGSAVTYRNLNTDPNVHLVGLTLNDRQQVLQYPGAYSAQLACIATDANGAITAWQLQLATEGSSTISAIYDPTNVCSGAYAPAQAATAVSVNPLDEDYGQTDGSHYGFFTDTSPALLHGSWSGSYPTVTVPNAGGCVAPQTCFTGGAASLQFRGNTAAVSGPITQLTCIVKADPRGKNCGARHRGDDGYDADPVPLKVNDVCPGFSNIKIPDYLCGAAGTNAAGTGPGTAFVLIKDITQDGPNGLDQQNGVFTRVEHTLPPSLVSAYNLPCPQFTAGVGARTDAIPPEEQDPEGALLLDGTSACGSSVSNSKPGGTIYSAGLKLRLDDSRQFGGNTAFARLVSFTQYKYINLSWVVLQTFGVHPAANSTGAMLESCLAKSLAYFITGKYAHAAEQIAQCEVIVDTQGAMTMGWTVFTPTFSPLWLPDPYGDVIRRLGNLYLTLNTRICGNPSVHTDWPLLYPVISDPGLKTNTACPQ